MNFKIFERILEKNGLKKIMPEIGSQYEENIHQVVDKASDSS